MLRKAESSKCTAAVDTLIIVGNGFDIWQGLGTDYKQFKNYYLANRAQILERLGLTMHWRVVTRDGEKNAFGDVEMVYGNPFDPHELEAGFWTTFEDSLGHVDSERLNSFFGKDDDDLDRFESTVENAQMILKEAFCSWISTIIIPSKPPDYHFGDNCRFINFNYTNTLERRFGVPRENVFHIHGEAAQKDSIIFGHALHPQLPVEELYAFGGRFRGLYLVDELLYKTDKHAYMHYVELLVYFARRGIRLADIKHIYVLGHSFGPADLEYFKELAIAVGAKRSVCKNGDFSAIDSLDALNLMIHYTILTYGNDGPHPEMDKTAALSFGEFVCQKQRDAVWESIQKQYRRKIFDRFKYPNRLSSLSEGLSASHKPAPADWHVTYHSEKEKLRIEETLRCINIENYKLYQAIDDCIAPFRI